MPARKRGWVINPGLPITIGSAPAWWPGIVLGSFAGLVGGNLWNRLVGLGWKLARLHGGSWRKLLPYNSVVEEVAERIARELRFGRWLEVFGPPRLGKTAGAVWGLVRWIFENNINTLHHKTRANSSPKRSRSLPLQSNGARPDGYQLWSNQPSISHTTSRTPDGDTRPPASSPRVL